MKVYFDENMSIHLIRSISALEKFDDKLNVLSTVEAIGGGVTDDYIVQKIKHEHATIITKDNDFRSMAIKRELFFDHGVGIILVKQTSGHKFWQFVKFFFHHWWEIRKTLINSRKPISGRVNARGFKLDDN